MSDTEGIADKLEMNPRENARFTTHLEEAISYSKKVASWRSWNFIWADQFASILDARE